MKGQEGEDGRGKTDIGPAGLYYGLQASVAKAIQIASVDNIIKKGQALDVIAELITRLSDKAEISHLTTEETLLRSALMVVQCKNNTHEGNKFEQYSNLIECHLEATFTCNASALNVAAFLSYVSLLLCLHYVFTDLHPIQDELTLVEISKEQSRDILAQWIGFQGGPLLYSEGGYDAGSLGLAISKSSVSQEEQEQWKALLGTEAVRVRLREAYSRVSGDAPKSQLVWSLYHQFEITHLPSSPSPQDLELVQGLYFARLRAPHAQVDSTLSSYSTFVSKFLPPKDYEGAMTSVYKLVTNAKETWAACEIHELQLASQLKDQGSSSSSHMRWTAWKGYLSWISHSLLHSHSKRTNAKLHLDLEAVCAVFERAIASCGLPPSCPEEMLAEGSQPLSLAELNTRRIAKYGKADKKTRKEREQQEMTAERDASLDLWKRYLTLLNAAKASSAIASDVCSRASKAIPSYSAIHAQILRTFCRLRRSKAQIDEYFSKAIDQVDINTNPTSFVELILSWLDVQREIVAGNLLIQGEASDLSEAVLLLPQVTESFVEMYSLMTFALSMLEERGVIDDLLRLETLTSEWCLCGGKETAPYAEEIWQKVTQVQSANSLSWQRSSQYYKQRGMFKKARSLLRQGLARRDISSDKKLALAEELFALEHICGGISEIEWALEKLDVERERSWNEYYANYVAQGEPQHHHHQQQEHQAAAEIAPDVEMVDGAEKGEKRKLTEDYTMQTGPIASTSRSEKRGREIDTKHTRDRENSSVLVDLLPVDATQDDILTLFKDCGEIREITGPKVVEGADGAPLAAALVEFTSRESIPAARSRQLKTIRSSQVNISMGWQCTLYVTNFSPEFDSDERMRSLFASFGRIFDVRWPSKKFANSRRFCYVQYCDAQSAQSALGLHEMEMTNVETGEVIKMQVLLSDPNRKKVRSDAQSNERELFLTGLPRGVEEEELASLFDQDLVVGVRIPKHPDGRNKGIAFVDMKTALDAQTALGRSREVEGGLRIKGKLITVNVADSAKNVSHSSNFNSASGGQGRDHRIRVRGLPFYAQEAIIQQLFEGCAGPDTVRRVDWTPGEAGRGMAVIEFNDVATAGRVALLPSMKYDDEHPLQLSTLDSRGAAAAASLSVNNPTAAFAPRQAARGRGRGRGGIGFARRGPPLSATTSAAASSTQASTTSDTNMEVDTNGTKASKKKPDAFREMLKKGN